MTEEEKKINTVAQKKRQISVRIPDLPISSNIESPDESRRDFLYYSTGGVGSVTVGAALWPSYLFYFLLLSRKNSPKTSHVDMK